MNKTMPFRLTTYFVIILMSFALSGCSGFLSKQDYAAQVQEEISTVETWPSLENSRDVAYLNHLFNSPEVDALLTHAFSNHPGLQQTRLTLALRKAQLKQTAAKQHFQVDAGLSATKQKASDNTYNGSASISWQADVWDKLQSSTDATQADIYQQQMLVNAAQNSLAADILTIWLELISQHKTLEIEHRRIAMFNQNESVILQRYRNGLGTLNDLASAQTSLASSRANLEVIQQQYEQNVRHLKSLVGQLSKVNVTIPNDYPDVAVAKFDLPQQTLAQRPDLKAAYFEIEAAHLRTHVAYKALLPSFNIEILLAQTATTLRDALFVSPVWSLLGQLTAPLYKGGELRADIDAAEIETAISYQRYKETLLTAVIEVENAIDQERSLNKQLSHLNSALESARNNLEQFEKSYRTGLVDILDLLAIQQQTYDLESRVNDTTFALLANRITLGLALALEIEK
jgi:NodT family efflux transporter outer membrane factor (OMF) lipoprotein